MPVGYICGIEEHILEIVSDAGEGAQRAGTAFAQVSAMMGNGLWTVQIIPSEIQPPHHTVAGTSGIRIRFGNGPITNGGDEAKVIVAFNERGLLARIYARALADDVLILIDSRWATHKDPEIRESYEAILEEVRRQGAVVREIPIEAEVLKVVDEPRHGKNMFSLGMLAYLYQRDLNLLQKIVERNFASKPQRVIDANLQLVQNGHAYAAEHLDVQYEMVALPPPEPMVALDGNQALAFGAIAAGFEVCSMYPITPATAASHALAGMFEEFGGLVHQAEDEIAAIGVALGSFYAGRPALTITSGPGLALKTEFQGLAAMTETPLVIVDVQRGGPSTGLPTKVEQSDLLAAIFGTPGDAPKVVMAPSTIEECFEMLATARKIAEELRMPVILLSDASLATSKQLFPRPVVMEESLPPPLDLNPVRRGTLPFDWDPKTGLSKRLIPGQPGGMCVTTSLNHSKAGLALYDSDSNQHAHTMRSRKLATLQNALLSPVVYGAEEGDLLLVGWGGTRGAIEEAVDRAGAVGLQVASLHIQFLNPLPPGLKSIFSRFQKVLTVELNYCDQPGEPQITDDNRRYGQLAFLLRARTLLDIDCFAIVPGRPFMPREIFERIVAEVQELRDGAVDVRGVLPPAGGRLTCSLELL